MAFTSGISSTPNLQKYIDATTIVPKSNQSKRNKPIIEKENGRLVCNFSEGETIGTFEFYSKTTNKIYSGIIDQDYPENPIILQEKDLKISYENRFKNVQKVHKVCIGPNNGQALVERPLNFHPIKF